jgi:hypothetical protein
MEKDYNLTVPIPVDFRKSSGTRVLLRIDFNFTDYGKGGAFVLRQMIGRNLILSTPKARALQMRGVRA